MRDYSTDSQVMTPQLMTWFVVVVVYLFVCLFFSSSCLFYFRFFLVTVGFLLVFVFHLFIYSFFYLFIIHWDGVRTKDRVFHWGGEWLWKH